MKSFVAKEICLSERGISLVSVMVAAGIMGVIALAMMRMQDNQLKTQNDMIARNEILNFTNKLSGYLNKGDYCIANFDGLDINESSSISLDEIINPVKRVLYKTGDKYGNNSFKLVSINQKEFFYDREDQTSGVLKLMISMEKSKKATGARIINKELEVFLYFDEDKKVIGCGDMFGGGTGATVTEPGLDVKEIQEALEKTATLDEDTQKEMVEAIENNPTLKLLQSTLKNIEESNEEFKNLEEKHLKEAGKL